MRKRRNSDTTPFETIRLEGALFVPELLERMATGEASAQAESDYEIPKGLKLHDEYGRSFRIATALWNDFAQQALRADIDAAAATRSFVLAFLRECLGYKDAAILDAPIELGGRQFPVAAMACGARVPIVIAPHRLGLDDPDADFAIMGSGARRKSAHQLAQEFLNASSDCLWAVVSNGRSIRLLRDAETLTRPSFLEFDVETVLAEASDRYADFAALWRILHSSRASAATVAGGVWEKWKADGHSQGIRVRDGLRNGVTRALLILGSGFLSHPENKELRQRLQDGSLSRNAYFQQLLRLIYRWLFVFCAEERNLLHSPDASEALRAAYADGYSMKRLRRRSLRYLARDSNGDLWVSVRILFKSLRAGENRLGLPPLGGLFAEDQCPDLDAANLTNRNLLDAMRKLRWFFDKRSGRGSAIDYRNMGPEELGSVYESLLELIPTVDLEAREFGFVGITSEGSSAGNARKTTGSYYTHDSLVQQLIKTALDPVIEQKLAANPEQPIEALLSISVCDPACGSGHFLLAAARRLAEKLASLRKPDGPVTNQDYRHALRDVTSHCIYGVDITPMAVELCRVALWLETVDPGRPLGFLDHHIRCGNSLLGTTPELISAGLPDDAYVTVKERGDDSQICSALKARNKAEREGFGPLFSKESSTARLKLLHVAEAIEEMGDDDSSKLADKKNAFVKSRNLPEFRTSKLLADAWCAAFLCSKGSERIRSLPLTSSPSLGAAQEQVAAPSQHELFGEESGKSAKRDTHKTKRTTARKRLAASEVNGITTQTLRDVVEGRTVDPELLREIDDLSRQNQFFHWHLAFPQVYSRGGFDCVLANPPWEKVKMEDVEFFTSFRPDIALAESTAERDGMISRLFSKDADQADRDLGAKYLAEKTRSLQISHFLRKSGLYPLCSGGDLNYYAVFTEKIESLMSQQGRAGFIVQSDIATGVTYHLYFKHLLSLGRLSSFHDFVNTEHLFAGLDTRNPHFCLITLVGSGGVKKPMFSFWNTRATHIEEPGRQYSLTQEDFETFNPETKTCPVFRTNRDAHINRLIYEHAPILKDGGEVSSSCWGVKLWRMFDKSTDSALLKKRELLEEQGFSLSRNVFEKGEKTYLPVWEGLLGYQYNHRYASFQNGGWVATDQTLLSDPDGFVMPELWAEKSVVDSKLAGSYGKAFLGHRRVSNATNERTVIATILPYGGATYGWILSSRLQPRQMLTLCLLYNSVIFDYCLRCSLTQPSIPQSVFAQIPCLSPDQFRGVDDYFLSRALELVFVTNDLKGFARDLGYEGEPFGWDPSKRLRLQAEIDAGIAHLFNLSYDDCNHVLNSYKRWEVNQTALYGEFVSRQLTLSAYREIGSSTHLRNTSPA
jgi:hypothetical protein